MRWLLVGLGLLGGIVVVLLATLLLRGGGDLPVGEVEGARIPEPVIAERERAQRSVALGLSSSEPPAERQILFGDLHVHTTYSIDAFIYALPIFADEGSHPPADACDFARYCSALDFFSINDHAEGLTPERWRETIDSIRACNARAGDPERPDLVAFLGWEWTQVGATPETHFGHKNVVVRGLEDDEVPPRPIAFLDRNDLQRAPNRLLLRLGEGAASFVGEPYADFLWWIRRLAAMPQCEPGVDTRELPLDCRETAYTPQELFAKLRQWGGDALVIPHGLAWGIHAPPGAALDNQLTRAQHDPERQRLIELFSGHGNSEEYRPWLHRDEAGSEEEHCPAPTPDHLACCWQAGEIMRSRCGDLPEAECQARVEEARRLALRAGIASHRVFPDAPMEAWLDCDQCRDCFKPDNKPRARESAQYSLAISNYDEADAEGRPLRFGWGFIASSDNHRARSSTGYKQFERRGTTDARGVRDPEVEARLAERLGAPETFDPQRPQPVDFNPRSFTALIDRERQASFMYPGGLVAVHAEARDRDAIFDALERKAVYGTSGPRILLWFDLLNGRRDFATGLVPMGGAARVDGAPRFRVRAAGAFRQKPGCPEHARQGLAPERLASLCLGECYHPADERHPIASIEVVRVWPQMEQDGDFRIEDPWRVFDCPPDPAGCQIEFSDPDFPGAERDVAYYVRALQPPTPAINGAQLRTRFDSEGRAIATEPCYGDHRTPADELCLAPVQERAWSSPIALMAD